jgi:hypothetical protein
MNTRTRFQAPEIGVREHLARGALVEVLPDYRPESGGAGVFGDEMRPEVREFIRSFQPMRRNISQVICPSISAL